MKKDKRDISKELKQEQELLKDFDIVNIQDIEIPDKHIQIDPNSEKDRIRVELITGLSFSDFQEKLEFGFIKNKKLKSGAYLVSYNDLSLNNYL